MGLDSNKDSEIKKKVWENLAHSLTELTVQDIADIMNKTASLSRVDMSGSCAWCSDFVKKRRYIAFNRTVDASNISYRTNKGITKYFTNFDVQLYFNTLIVYNVVSFGTVEGMSFSSVLTVLRNGKKIGSYPFKVSKEMRVIMMPTKRNHRYVGEVMIDLPDPATLTDSDEIKVKLETWLITSVDEGSEAGLPAQAYIDVAHEVVEYDESN